MVVPHHKGEHEVRVAERQQAGREDIAQRQRDCPAAGRNVLPEATGRSLGVSLGHQQERPRRAVSFCYGSPRIDKYLTELLALPTHKEEVGVGGGVVEVSLNCVKYLCNAALKNVKHFESCCPEFAKNLNKIKPFISAKKKSPFVPKTELFEQIHKHPSKSGEGIYYILLRSEAGEEPTTPKITVGEREKVLHGLLSELKLEEYCAMPLGVEGEGIVEDILAKLQELPELFDVLPSKMNRVTLLTQFMLKHVKEGFVITDKEITEAINTYQQAINVVTKESRNLYKQAKIIAVRNKAILHRIDAKITQLRTEILPLLLAESIINMNKFLPFSIERVEFQNAGERSPQRAPSEHLTARSKTMMLSSAAEEAKDFGLM